MSKDVHVTKLEIENTNYEVVEQDILKLIEAIKINRNCCY